MRRLFVFLIASGFVSTVCAETRWQKINQQDELTDEKQDVVVVFSDEKNLDLASAFCIAFEKGEPKHIGLGVGKLERILPERLGSNEVSVTHRAKDAPKRTSKWKLFPGNREIHLQPPTKEAAVEMISGDSLIIQIDHTGKRYKFDMSGPEGEKLREYVHQRLGARR